MVVAETKGTLGGLDVDEVTKDLALQILERCSTTELEVRTSPSRLHQLMVPKTSQLRVMQGLAEGQDHNSGLQGRASGCRILKGSCGWQAQSISLIA